jgi:hypothetical protein
MVLVKEGPLVKRISGAVPSSRMAIYESSIVSSNKTATI